jgi:hypothetical protein
MLMIPGVLLVEDTAGRCTGCCTITGRASPCATIMLEEKTIMSKERRSFMGFNLSSCVPRLYKASSRREVAGYSEGEAAGDHSY